MCPNSYLTIWVCKCAFTMIRMAVEQRGPPTLPFKSLHYHTQQPRYTYNFDFVCNSSANGYSIIKMYFIFNQLCCIAYFPLFSLVNCFIYQFNSIAELLSSDLSLYQSLVGKFTETWGCKGPLQQNFQPSI